MQGPKDVLSYNVGPYRRQKTLSLCMLKWIKDCWSFQKSSSLTSTNLRDNGYFNDYISNWRYKYKTKFLRRYYWWRKHYWHSRKSRTLPLSSLQKITRARNSLLSILAPSSSCCEKKNQGRASLVLRECTLCRSSTLSACSFRLSFCKSLI